MRLFPWKSWFKEARQKERSGSLKEIVYGAVGRNTFRAFRHLRVPPSTAFREWALKALDETRLLALSNVSDQARYTAWLYKLSEDLRADWHRVEGVGIPFGPSLKLPNLLAKQLCFSPEVSDATFKRIIWYLEVPLDSFTIRAVRSCLDVFPERTAIGAIPRSATTSFINELPPDSAQMIVRI